MSLEGLLRRGRAASWKAARRPIGQRDQGQMHPDLVEDVFPVSNPPGDPLVIFPT